MSKDEAVPRSRRAILAAAGGGALALLAQALGRPSSIRAAHGDVHLGDLNFATVRTQIMNTSETGNAFEGVVGGSGTGVLASSYSGYGVSGTSWTNIGVLGWSSTDRGVYGFSASSHATYAYSDSTTKSAALGWSAGINTGVQGYSGTTDPPASPVKTGVFGYAAQDGAARGVVGQTTAGRGVEGVATSGVGGHFSAGPTGMALQTAGRVAFSTSGLAAVTVGSTSVTVAPASDLVAGSGILCTLETNQAGLSIQRVTKAVGANTFRVYLAAALRSGKTARVAWFVIG